jgi:hypothetical protein
MIYRPTALFLVIFCLWMLPMYAQNACSEDVAKVMADRALHALLNDDFEAYWTVKDPSKPADFVRFLYDFERKALADVEIAHFLEVSTTTYAGRIAVTYEVQPIDKLFQVIFTHDDKPCKILQFTGPYTKELAGGAAGA